MLFSQASPILKSAAVRSVARAATKSSPAAQSRLYAQESYGGADDDPKGGDPQSQGSNPSASLEHPGPPPPAVGQGTGGGPTKAGKDGHNVHENESSSNIESKGGSTSTAKAAQPKIHGSDAPLEHELSEDVKKHNEDMSNRHGQAQSTADSGDHEKQKVGKGFWSGRGGADRDP